MTQSQILDYYLVAAVYVILIALGWVFVRYFRNSTLALLIVKLFSNLSK